MGKYFKIIGDEAVNKNKINFYRLLYFIGKNAEKIQKKRIKSAINFIIEYAIEKEHTNLTKTEIKNLIREKNSKLRGSIYKLSTNSDLILEIIFNIVTDIEKKYNNTISKETKNKLNNDKYCRKQIISNIDEKLDKIENPFFIKKDIEILKDNILMLRKKC